MKPIWHSNLVLVCEKCGKKLARKSGDNPAIEMKDWMKKQLRDRDLWGRTRVVTTSCLDVCPEGRVAVAFVSDRKDLEATVEIVDPETERDRVLHVAIERARPEP
jgi:predicted metal-binding protein